MAGNGVHMARAHGLVRELAELWGMPIATSYKGKSVVEETHPQAVGMIGVYGQQAANALVGDADTLLVVGARLSSQDTVRERPHVFDPRRQRIIQIDIDPRNAGWTFPVELGLVGDAASILAQLVEASRPIAMRSQERVRKSVEGIYHSKDRLGYYRDPRPSRGLITGATPAPGGDPSGDPRPNHPHRLGRRQQSNLDVPSVPVTATGDFFLPRWHSRHGLEPSRIPGVEAGPPGKAGVFGNGGRWLHDVCARSFHGDAI